MSNPTASDLTARMTPAQRADFHRRNPHLASLAPTMPEDVRETLAEYKDEDELQDACIGILRARGYVYASADMAIAHKGRPVKGWWAHLYETKRNPLCPDLMVYNDNMTRCLHVELKIVREGRKTPHYQHGQLPMIERGAWIECRNVAQFTGAMDDFERTCALHRRVIGDTKQCVSNS